MSVANFIPAIWSESLLKNLDKDYVFVSNCNREYEGEIKEKGSTVKVCGVNAVTVKDYEKGKNITQAQELDDYYVSLRINTAKYFHFQVDDIDRIQAYPHYMDGALHNASRALAAAAEQVVFEKCCSTENRFEYPEQATADTIIRAILAARTHFCEVNNCVPNDLILEVSPRVAALIVEAKINLVHDNNETMENGYLGSVGGCKIYVSPLIKAFLNGVDIWSYECILRTKRAVAFAEQVSEIEAYRPELRFADAVKGLHLYGCEIMYPNEVFIVTIPVDKDGETV